MSSATLSIFFASMLIGSMFLTPMSIVSMLFILTLGYVWLKRARNDYFLSLRDKQIGLFRLGDTRDLPFITYRKK